MISILQKQNLGHIAGHVLNILSSVQFVCMAAWGCRLCPALQEGSAAAGAAPEGLELSAKHRALCGGADRGSVQDEAPI